MPTAEQPIPCPTETPEDGDCDENLTPEMAAIRYATISNANYYQPIAGVLGANPPVTFAVTKVKTGNVCPEYVAINISLDSRRRRRLELWQNARSIVTSLAASRNARAFIGTSEQPGRGKRGHAERVLYRNVAPIAESGTFRAIGISQDPCSGDDGCMMWLRKDILSQGVKVAYRDRMTHQIVLL